MTAGSTKTWRDILNTTKLDGSAFLQYYEPLLEWLAQDNAAKNLDVGWQSEDSKYKQLFKSRITIHS